MRHEVKMTVGVTIGCFLWLLVGLFGPQQAAFAEASLSTSRPTESPTESSDEPIRSNLNWQELAPGVYAATQHHESRFNDANSLVVIGETGVLVVDAQASRESVEEVIAQVAKLTDQPIRWVINTHWHGDHVQGNAVYREHLGAGVVFVGHDTLAVDIPGRAASAVTERIATLEEIVPVAEEQLAKGLSRAGEPLDEAGQEQQRASIERAKQWLKDHRDVVFWPPDLTFSDRLTLHLGGGKRPAAAGTPPTAAGRRVELIHLTGHTRGDTVVYLPDAGVLASGDLIDAAPFGGHGFPSSWISAIDQLLALELRTVVPGHGPVFRGEAHLRAVRAYFVELVRQVTDLHAQEVEGEPKTGESDPPLAERIAEKLDLSVVEDGLAQGDDGVIAFLRGSLVETVERVIAEPHGLGESR